MEAQTERVTKLFERQLQIPHGNMQATMEEYEEWRRLGGNHNSVDDKIRKAFVDAKKKLAPLQKLEDELEAAAEDQKDATDKEAMDASATTKTDVFKKYIDYELSQDSPGRIQLIYERAITDNPLNAELWIQVNLF